jgi:hypothetical protein
MEDDLLIGNCSFDWYCYRLRDVFAYGKVITSTRGMLVVELHSEALVPFANLLILTFAH